MIEMALRTEMRSSFDQYGLTMLRAFAVVNETDLEKLQSYNNQTNVLVGRADVVNRVALAAVERQQMLTLARIEAEAEIARARAQGAVEIALESDLIDLRKLEAEWAAERHEIAARQEVELNGRQQQLEMAMDAFERVQSAKRARMALQSPQNGGGGKQCACCSSEAEVGWNVCPHCGNQL